MCVGPRCGEGITYCIVLVLNTLYSLCLNGVVPLLDLWVDGVVSEYILADDSSLLVFDGYGILFCGVNACVTPLFPFLSICR